jgi:rRNA maturation protein Nop10
MRLLRRCDCRYTINQEIDICEQCNKSFKNAIPPKFSLHDKYASYLRQMKEIAKQRGIL